MSCIISDCTHDHNADYPACPAHERTAHFTHRTDCRCCGCIATAVYVHERITRAFDNAPAPSHLRSGLARLMNAINSYLRIARREEEAEF